MGARDDIWEGVDRETLERQAMQMVLRLLKFRSRSRHELVAALQRRSIPEEVCDAVIDRVAGLGYLDDEKFAQGRALALLRDGRLGPDAVRARLLAHGLSEAQAQAAIDAATRELDFDPLASARALLEKRGVMAQTSSTSKERARAARLLHSRGYSSDVIAALLGSADE